MLDALPQCGFSRRLMRTDVPRGIVLHYTSAVYVDPDRWDDADAVRRLLLDLNRSMEKREWYPMENTPERMFASYHYLIDRCGKQYDMVPDERVAYHAGESELHGIEGCNEFTFGVALIATHDSGFTDAQYARLGVYCAQAMTRYGFGEDWIAGHDEVARPKGRKKDPGPNFDWPRLREQLRGLREPTT